MQTLKEPREDAGGREGSAMSSGDSQRTDVQRKGVTHSSGAEGPGWAGRGGRAAADTGVGARPGAFEEE